MGRVSLPPPVCDTNLSQRMSFENNNNPREASFSSYLNHAEREFVRKLAESTRDRSNSKEEDGDIEVFGAEKYFNGGIESPNPVKLRPEQQQQSKKPAQMSTQINKPKNGSSTPSVRSEASWNSQNALLQNVNRDYVSKATKKKKKSSQLVKGLLYKFYCCDKKSVEVGRKQPPPPPPPPTKAGGINFTFQSLIPEATKNSTLKMQIQVGEQQGRKSIEVFGSSLKGKPPSVDTLNLNNLEKKLSMMAWNDIVPRVKDSNPNSNSSLSTTNNNSNQIYDDDVESDTSSDLFEIENLTGNPNAILTRQGSDCTNCYAPSEASIDWSVITASAADFSVVSDYNEWRLSTTSPVKNVSAAAAAAYIIKSSFGSDSNEIQRPPSNLLMGCNNQKALRVVGDKYDSSAEVHRRTELFGRLTRFEAETKIMGFGSNQRLAISRNHSNY